MDAVFRALADPSRRRLLDRLNERNGQSLRELCDGLDMARQSVTKHLSILEAAGVVTTVRRGREKLHFLDSAPLNDIADRWLSSYDRHRARTLSDLKHAIEAVDQPTEFTYTTYINTTAERLWRALTEPAFTSRYWGAELLSDWQVGSTVLWREGDGEPRDLGVVVLEADRPHRLAYTWPTVQQMHADLFGWSAHRLAEIQREPRSQARFELTVHGPSVKLVVRHSGFAPGSPVLEAASGRTDKTGGWPELLSNLKSLLESGEPPGP